MVGGWPPAHPCSPGSTSLSWRNRLGHCCAKRGTNVFLWKNRGQPHTLGISTDNFSTTCTKNSLATAFHSGALLVGSGDHRFDPWLLPAKLFGSQWCLYSSFSALMFCLGKALKYLWLIYSNDAINELWAGVTCWGESCDSVLLLLMCETQTDFNAGLSCSQIFVKNLTNPLAGDAQLVLHQFEGHLMVSGHQVMNCCKCSCIPDSWWPPIPWISLMILIPLSELFKPFEDTCMMQHYVHNSFQQVMCFCSCCPDLETELDLSLLFHANCTWGCYGWTKLDLSFH